MLFFKLDNLPFSSLKIVSLATHETYFVSKTEERQEILNEFSNPVKQSRTKVQQQEDNDSQLSLF